MPAAGRSLALLGIALSLAASAQADAHDDFVAGNAAVAQKQWPDAAQDYMRVTAQLPKFASAWKALASCRYYMGDLEGAVASSDRYLDLQPQDAAFAAWANSLRAKLQLPPRTTPAPTAAATPAATPAPADAGILVAAPAPDAEAESVPLEAAQALNADAAEGVVDREKQATADAAAEMAADAAKVKAQQRGPAHERGPVHAGLRVLGGWALGLGSFGYGEAVDDPSALSSQAFRFLGEHCDRVGVLLDMGCGGIFGFLIAPLRKQPLDLVKSLRMIAVVDARHLAGASPISRGKVIDLEMAVRVASGFVIDNFAGLFSGSHGEGKVKSGKVRR